MARIASVDLPRDKRVEIALTYIYGIGLTLSQEIIMTTGVNPDTRVRDLTDALRDREPVGVWLAVQPGTVPCLGDAEHPLDELALIRLVSPRRPKAQTPIFSPHAR